MRAGASLGEDAPAAWRGAVYRGGQGQVLARTHPARRRGVVGHEAAAVVHGRGSGQCFIAEHARSAVKLCSVRLLVKYWDFTVEYCM